MRAVSLRTPMSGFDQGARWLSVVLYQIQTDLGLEVCRGKARILIPRLLGARGRPEPSRIFIFGRQANTDPFDVALGTVFQQGRSTRSKDYVPYRGALQCARPHLSRHALIPGTLDLSQLPRLAVSRWSLP